MPHDVCIVTLPRLMRGFDYRCDTGIVLLLARQLDSERASQQALCRVGRYGEFCARYVTEQLFSKGLVDKAQQNKLISYAMEALTKKREAQTRIQAEQKQKAKGAKQLGTKRQLSLRHMAAVTTTNSEHQEKGAA